MGVVIFMFQFIRWQVLPIIIIIWGNEPIFGLGMLSYLRLISDSFGLILDIYMGPSYIWHIGPILNVPY
jgi:hypothetical protein